MNAVEYLQSFEDSTNAHKQISLRHAPAAEQIPTYYPWLSPDGDARTLKCAKAFGEDARRISSWCEHRGIPFSFDGEKDEVAFPVRCTGNVLENFPRSELVKCTYTVEKEGDALYLREESAHAVAALED